jgi:hypothetical protein
LRWCAGSAGGCRRHGAWPSWRTIASPLETSLPIGLPITAAGLITEISRFTLDLAPYLELMDEIGLTLSDRCAD